MRKIASLLSVLMLFCALAHGQTHAVTGTVRDEKGNPIPNATISIVHSKTATKADENGNFKINVENGQSLSVSASGFKAQTIVVPENATTVIANLSVTNDQMSEVVVTALGIRRNSNALSYATQGLKSDRLTTTRMPDVNNALAGKIAGVQVRSQSESKLGSASTIRLRGAGSIVDKNPLYVIDGTPIDDINAINIDDIDDIQVLKGPAATALYGQRADAGVILVTTKKGKNRPGMGVDVSSSVVVNSVGMLPDFQNEYAGGTPGVGWKTFTWDPSMPAEWKALDGKKYHTYFDDASWGPKMDGSEYIPWYAWYPGSKYSFKTANLTPQPNNVRNFFDKGVQYTNNISLSKANDIFSSRLSYSNQRENGLIPGSNLNKHLFSTQNSVNLTSQLTFAANINFMTQQVNGEFSDTYGNNASGSFNQWFHRDLDTRILRELQGLRTPTGAIPGWNLDDENGISKDAVYGGTLYWTNPFTYFNLSKGYPMEFSH